MSINSRQTEIDDDVPDCVVSTGPVETVRFVTGIKS